MSKDKMIFDPNSSTTVQAGGLAGAVQLKVGRMISGASARGKSIAETKKIGRRGLVAGIAALAIGGPVAGSKLAKAVDSVNSQAGVPTRQLEEVRSGIGRTAHEDQVLKATRPLSVEQNPGLQITPEQPPTVNPDAVVHPAGD